MSLRLQTSTAGMPRPLPTHSHIPILSCLSVHTPTYPPFSLFLTHAYTYIHTHKPTYPPSHPRHPHTTKQIQRTGSVPCPPSPSATWSPPCSAPSSRTSASSTRTSSCGTGKPSSASRHADLFSLPLCGRHTCLDCSNTPCVCVCTFIRHRPDQPSHPAFNKTLQVWRLVTPFTFFGNLGMNLVMQLFMLVQYSTR